MDNKNVLFINLVCLSVSSNVIFIYSRCTHASKLYTLIGFLPLTIRTACNNKVHFSKVSYSGVL